MWGQGSVENELRRRKRLLNGDLGVMKAGFLPIKGLLRRIDWSARMIERRSNLMLNLLMERLTKSVTVWRSAGESAC